MSFNLSNIRCMGQPTRDELEQARDAGCTTVINLRMPSEQTDFDEAALVKELGMKYVHLPVGAPDGVTAEQAEKFAGILREAGDCHIIAHCATANRVGALVAIAAWQDGTSREEAIELGKKAGLASLEARVREVIGAE